MQQPGPPSPPQPPQPHLTPQPPPPWRPAPPSPPKEAHAWWGIDTRWWLLGIGLVAVLPVLVCASLQAVLGPRRGAPSIVYVTATATTAYPTATPTATATPSGPHPIDAPTLGGTEAAFTAAYGQPYHKGSVPWWDYTTPEGWHVTTCFCGTSTGVDGKERVEAFGFYPTDGVPFNGAQTDVLLKQFLPHDAVWVRDFTDPDLGLIHVYTSADLAATFDASHFRDSNGGPNPPVGTFSVDCNNPVGPGCDIAIGT